MALRPTFFLSALSAVLILSCANAAEGDATTPPGGKTSGARLFSTNCTLCHGKDGTMGINGAKDLTLSQLSKDEMIALVSNGKGAMAAYKNVLSKSEIEAVVEHVRSLKPTE